MNAFELRVYGVNPATIEAQILGLPSAPRTGLSVYGVELGVLIIADRVPSPEFVSELHALLEQETLAEAVRRNIEPPPSDSDTILEQLVDLLKNNDVIPRDDKADTGEVIVNL